MKTVVIIGGGFAGLAAAARLRRAGDGVEVILIDRRPAHQFLPLLPDLVGRDLDPSLLCYPLARAAAQTRCRLVQATVHAVDIAARRVLTDGDVSLTGLPVIGFAAMSFENGTLTVDGVNVLSNYMGSTVHKGERTIIAPAP